MIIHPLQSFWNGYMLATLAFVWSAGAALAAPVNPVSPGALTTNALADFTSLPFGNTDSIVTLGGAHFGERLAGQTLSFSAEFDVVTGAPSLPLTLLAASP